MKIFLNLPRCCIKLNHTEMGELVGKASACLREAASAEAGANLQCKEHLHLSPSLEFTFSGVLRLPQNVNSTAVRSLEERFTHVCFCNHWVNLVVA